MKLLLEILYFELGSLIWWNGISDPGFDKSFKWNEWVWFGFVPAVVPFILYLIWKKSIGKIKKNIKLKISNNKEEIQKRKGSYSAEEKIEIKKIKKQATEKRRYNIKDFVVYPKHGVGKIIAVEKATIGQIDIQFYKIFIEKEKLTLTVPINQQTNLRPISTINQINKCISILKSKPKIKRTMWSRRAQEYEQKINSGKLYELAEVVRDLNKKTDTIAEQSYSERQLFEKAYERLKSELEVVLSDKAQKKMDKALKREDNTENPESKEIITA